MLHLLSTCRVYARILHIILCYIALEYIVVCYSIFHL